MALQDKSGEGGGGVGDHIQHSYSLKKYLRTKFHLIRLENTWD